LRSFRFFILAFILITTSCREIPVVTPEITNEVPTLRAVPSTATPFLPAQPTKTVSPTPTPTSTPTPVICRDEHGQVERLQLISHYLPEPLHFRVYSPPCYDLQLESCYPVLYLIHGQTYSDNQWDQLGADEAADLLITSEESPPFLIIMPNESNTYADIYKSGFPEAVLEELIPWVDQQYTTCDQRSDRAIGGLSRGGAWSIHMGFSHWHLFSAIGAHSTPPFDGDLNRLPGWLNEIPPQDLPRIYIDIGRGDPFYTDALALENILTRKNVLHEWQLNNGGHNERYWESHVIDYLRWYTKPWSINKSD
jgi:enterochelin esterase-like enzyme